MSIMGWLSGLALLIATPPNAAPTTTATTSTATTTATPDAIVVIQERFRSIETSSALVVSTKDLAGLSLEGGTLKVWRAGKQIAKLDAHLFGEMWQSHETFYFDERDQLVFVHKVTTNYLEPFEPKGATVEEQRLYFAGDKLIRWIEAKDAQPVPLSDRRSIAVGAEARQRARDFHAFARSKNATFKAARP